MLFLRLAFCVAAIAGVVYSCVWARAAYLFSHDTESAVAEAARLVPYDAAYLARLAAWDSAGRKDLLEKAVELNPFDSQSFIQLGLDAELQRQDFRAAEDDYLKAADCDRTFLPKWTLANFYFRRQNETQFLHWARETLQITPYSPDPVFNEMWLMSDDAAANESAIPDRPSILLQYAAFLSSGDRFNPIPPIVSRLAALSKLGRDDVVAPIEDRLLLNGHADAAMDVWQTLNRKGWIQAGVPTAAEPLVNGNFAVPIFGHGFDWMLNRGSGLDFEQHIPTGGLTIKLDGTQPEECTLLQQYLDLEAGRTYVLTWGAKSSDIDLPSGLAWRVGSADSADILAQANQTWKFAPGEKLVRLALEYRRSEGKTRVAGSLELRSVALRPD